MLLSFYGNRTCQIHEEKIKTAEELLRRRELAVKTMEDTYDQKLKNELSRYLLSVLCVYYTVYIIIIICDIKINTVILLVNFKYFPAK